MAINVSDIVDEFGALYKDNGQTQADIAQKLYAQTDTQELFSTRVSKDDTYNASVAEVDRILQPFQKAFTPIGTANFIPRTIYNRRVKVDFLIEPDEVVASWLGFLYDQKLTREQMPITKYIVEQLLVQKAKEDHELNEIVKGVYAVPTPGTAGDAGTTVDGIYKQIDVMRGAGTCNVISTGALETNPKDFCTQIEEFRAQIASRYRRQDMVLAMNPDLEMRYMDGVTEKYNLQSIGFADGRTNKVKNSNLIVKGYESLNDMDFIFCTPKANAVRLLRGNNGFENLELQRYDRQVKVMADWWIGYGFLITQAIFCNDWD
jgi:hypothetical protein